MSAVPEAISLKDKLASFQDHWNPRVIGRYNGNELRVAKVLGDFTWHSHADTDELFLVVHGELGIEFRDGIRTFQQGELVVVPQGTEHRPFALEECHIMLIDREGASNTGDSPSHLTRTQREEI